jgi:hypothetical protein
MFMQFPENTIIELATLGVCINQPLSSHKVIAIIKNLMPELWSPTAEVVMSTIEQCMSSGHLEFDDVTSISPTMMRATCAGKRQLETLLLINPGEGSSQTTSALEIMQMCFLDLVNANIAENVLVRTRKRLKTRLSNFRKRSKQCLHVGQYTNLWFLLETRRLESSVHILDLAYDKINHDHITQTHKSGAFS